MLPDRVSNPGPLTYESGALPIALRGPAIRFVTTQKKVTFKCRVTNLHDWRSLAQPYATWDTLEYFLGQVVNRFLETDRVSTF